MIARGARAARGRVLLALALGGALAAAAPRAAAQFVPYYGKNKVQYDSFGWRVYRSPHFEVYYYPEFEQHLARLVSYLESAYQKIAAELKHEIPQPIPVIFYKTHSEFEQTNLIPAFVPEEVAAFTEPVRDRMVVPIDEPPDKLQGLITHELAHVFEFSLIPRTLVQRDVPLWIDEGLADYLRGAWDPLDIMMVRDAAVTDQVPRLSRAEFQPLSGRLVYNLGHAAFEFIADRYGKEGIRQFLYTWRKNVVGGRLDEIYQQAFRVKPEEFDEAFEKWLKERFKPFRDKQRPSDYGLSLSPNEERTPFSQVFAAAASPSGEMIAAITANRSDGEADLVLLSARDGSIIRNLTSGSSNDYRNLTFNDDFTAGRTIDFDPSGDRVAVVARTGKRRSLLLLSPLSGGVQKVLTPELDQLQSPCLLPDGRRALVVANKDGVSDVFLLDLESGAVTNLTQDSFSDANPRSSPDGRTVVYTRRISGHSKLFAFPLEDPARRTQLTFGAHDDAAPIFSADGQTLYYSSNENDEIFNLRSLDLRTGVVRQYTDVLGGNLAPFPLRSGKPGTERLGFLTYYKGEFLLKALDLGDPLSEPEQDVRPLDEESVDFQPDIQHQVVPQNKRRKGTFEKLFLEGRPPLNVGVTSSGDFFGGSQVALADVLGDKNFVATALSVREFRSYQGTYLNLGRRFQYALSAFDNTQFFFATPFNLDPGFFREGAIATQRLTGASLVGQYPLDVFRRVEVGVGAYKLRERFENSAVEAQLRQQAAAAGQPFFLNDGSIVPISLNLVQETTRFREFGPLSGSTFNVGLELAPGLGGALSRRTVEADLRKYMRVGGTLVFAARVRGFKSGGDNPGVFYFGGNMELRGYPYLSFAGTEGFFANLELRFPVIELAKTPLGLIGPLRGTLFAGVGGARFRGQPFKLLTRKAGPSYVNFNANDPSTVFGEQVGPGLRLVDGRASYGVGLQLFFLGYPLHFDWIKLTDLQVASKTRFDFWIGYDF